MSTDLSQSNLNFIFGRRSIRVFSPGTVSDADVTLILQAAMAAPSAMTKDPWRFITVRNRESLAQLKTILPGGGMLPTADLAILVCGDLDAAFERSMGYLLQDCSAATENLLLAAHNLGLGACWVGIYPSEPSVQKVKAGFGLPSPIVPLAAIAIGRPGEQPEARTRYCADYVRSERW